MLNRKEITAMSMLQQEKHKLQGRISMIHDIIRDDELSTEATVKYIRETLAYSKQIRVIESELDKMYSQIKGGKK